MERTENTKKAFELFEEANRLSPRNPVVMSALGDRLITRKQKERGREMLREAGELFQEMLLHGSLDMGDVGRAKKLAKFLNDTSFLEQLRKYEVTLSAKTNLFTEKFLAASIISKTIKS